MADPLKNICDDPLERTWVWISLALAVVMGVMLGYFAVANNLHPPSNVETIDSSRLHLSEEFAEDNLGVKTNPDGSVRVTLVAARYGFYPPRIEVPAVAIDHRFGTFDAGFDHCLDFLRGHYLLLSLLFAR